MMDVCRLCCTDSQVRNDIFDEESALHLKMSLYMPIKIFRNDDLPQKVCDKCSSKVNDLYQFCNQAIEVQNRLRGILSLSKESFEGNTVKRLLSPELNQETETHKLLHTTFDASNVKVKIEPSESLSPEVIPEDDNIELNIDQTPTVQSDDSDNVPLLSIKKRKKKKRLKKVHLNGDTDKKPKDLITGKSKKKSSKLQVQWQKLLEELPKDNTAVVPIIKNEDVKQEEDSSGLEDLFDLEAKKMKQEPDSYNCCMCFLKCYSRTDMLQHYKEHGDDLDMGAEPPPPPPPPDQTPMRCTRCSKAMWSLEQWAAHWRGHWSRDRAPYRCARCERTFRSPHTILKHGLSHDCSGSQKTESTTQGKRFICDLCPEEFVYMRYLLGHRARCHPEAAGEAPRLRCAVCSAQFAHVNSLQRHLRAHAGTRDHLCSVCGKALSSREHLKFHLRIHTGYKPNVCKTCGKGFVKKCNLVLHERTHSGEKPHVCSHCSKAFSQRSTLVIHERYHSGARPYTCTLCGRGFVAKGLLSMHLKTTCI